MKETTPKHDTQSSTPKPKNQGEGDKISAERFNQMEKEFVQSDRGRKAIDKGVDVDDEERIELEEAERQGKARAKGEDPAVKRDDHERRQHSSK